MNTGISENPRRAAEIDIDAPMFHLKLKYYILLYFKTFVTSWSISFYKIIHRDDAEYNLKIQWNGMVRVDRHSRTGRDNLVNSGKREKVRKGCER